MKLINSIILKRAQNLPEWHDIAVKYAFNSQSISKDQVFAKMKPAFIDSEGKRYFEFTDLYDMPLPRHDELQIILIEIANRISYDDLDNFIAIGLKIVDEKKKISEISFMLQALKRRRELLYDPYLMFKLCAAIYIREDQDPTIWDDELEKKKIIQFKKDFAGGLYDFFHKAGLAKYLPAYTRSKTPLMQQQEADNMEYQKESFIELLTSLQ